MSKPLSAGQIEQLRHLHEEASKARNEAVEEMGIEEAVALIHKYHSLMNLTGGMSTIALFAAESLCEGILALEEKLAQEAAA